MRNPFYVKYLVIMGPIVNLQNIWIMCIYLFSCSAPCHCSGSGWLQMSQGSRYCVLGSLTDPASGVMSYTALTLPR